MIGSRPSRRLDAQGLFEDFPDRYIGQRARSFNFFIAAIIVVTVAVVHSAPFVDKQPGIIVLGQVSGDVSIFDRPGPINVRLERMD